jgi:two-component system, chemotaxis family, chemotaxis protein CheY
MAAIIIADDSPFQRKILGDMILLLGHTLESVDSGEALLEKVKNNKYDCICLDLLMPEMTGIEVLKKLREMNNKIPVIIVTADIQTIRKEECAALGAKAFVNKYVNKLELEEALKTTLGLNLL